ncbi:probable NOT transcription complex subunit VIP2 isoform X2 [Brassica rapa]|uniref:probable NOT transcription complex subunit VIP2 isoform X2 n=1 Tax=Brassica campestris TaxID=3711 RepID=UPI00142D6848|nr:probable NOT transcription complex subunit VIP2 isoform X2 [Brassica rapa]
MVSRFCSFFFLKSSYSELIHFVCFLCGIGTLKGVYDVKENFFISTSNAPHAGPRNSVFGAPTLVNTTSSRAPPPPSSMGNTAGGGSMSRALVSDGGSILSSTGSMGGGGSMSRALISDGGSILSSIGSMGGGGSMSRGLISDGGSIMSSTESMGGGGLLSRALISDGGNIMSSMGSMDGSTEHNRSMMFGLQGSPQVYSMPGSSYPYAAGGHFQTHVQAMNSLSSMSLMNSNYMTTDYQMDLQQQELMMQSQQSSVSFLALSIKYHWVCVPYIEG